MVNARGYLFISLNAVRFLSIVGLILLFSSSIVAMVHDVKAVNAFIADGKSDASSTTSNLTSTDNSFDCSVYDCDYIEGSTVPNQPAGAFWAVLNRLLIIFQCIILILSECSWPSQFFSSYFPVLGPSFGLGALGVIQCLLGAAVLSHHVDEFSLVSAFFVFSIGCLNILLGLIFRESVKHKRSIREWKEKEPGTLPTVRDGKVPRFDVSRNVFLDRPVSDEKGAFGAYRSGSLSSQKVGFGFGRQGEKMAANQGDCNISHHPSGV
ncbi:hypothetical protein EW026_g6308 [Hermanssonia centrifuga]|uniref:DUF7598 domain-containing protein n=1 Tax=Hermanssonia centrifuga TaxID=98765 RepID=A0A4S4KBF6_9APHY|nr:hypothetical protein EW026_g6308 [Hermanssonia centrifuga]